MATTTCDIYAVFGTGSPTTGVTCDLLPNFRTSRCTADLPTWTHVLIVDASVTIADACTRLSGSNGLTYADGGEVRVPSGVSNRYVVVWVESDGINKRVYLMRHSVADWTQL